ncbi:DUF1573 domain-containing protein [Marinicrinis lubricantis]|uniref:DUF1573 domain-containing protein n=1 Tax=Marinicrinis lubricantis TaxID=2086470 RepID=A0ABW1IS85_9BACL
MSVQNLNEFQELVSKLLLRHRSLLDVLSKIDQSSSAVHRSVIKAVTECGCIELHGKKQMLTSEMTIEDAKKILDSQVEGGLCESCQEAVSAQLGRNLFYLSSLCNLLDLKLEKVVEDEAKRCSTLGIFNMS